MPITYELGAPAPGDVTVEISHCSICFSDIDVIDDAFGRTTYPVVAGHEVVGTVAAVGSAVTGLEVGQRVGVGPQRGACLRCESCLAGRENLCRDAVSTAASGLPGGFATAMQLPAEFAAPIPAALDSAGAAPLLCAGLTVFSPLMRYAPTPTRVGVLGVGGLGHLALQFASRMGHHVTAFTDVDGAGERERQRALGADEIVDTRDPSQMRAARSHVDVLISTVHGNVDLAPYVVTLKPAGTLVLIGNTPGPLGDVLAHLILGERRIVGSAQGPRLMTRRMLEFAAREGVRASAELADMATINEGIDRVRQGLPRYRVVLANGPSPSEDSGA